MEPRSLARGDAWRLQITTMSTPSEIQRAQPRRHPDVAWRNWDGEVVILTPSGHDPDAPPEQQPVTRRSVPAPCRAFV